MLLLLVSFHASNRPRSIYSSTSNRSDRSDRSLTPLLHLPAGVRCCTEDRRIVQIYMLWYPPSPAAAFTIRSKSRPLNVPGRLCRLPWPMNTCPASFLEKKNTRRGKQQLKVRDVYSCQHRQARGSPGNTSFYTLIVRTIPTSPTRRRAYIQDLMYSMYI